MPEDGKYFGWDKLTSNTNSLCSLSWIVLIRFSSNLVTMFVGIWLRLSLMTPGVLALLDYVPWIIQHWSNQPGWVYFVLTLMFVDRNIVFKKSHSNTVFYNTVALQDLGSYLLYLIIFTLILLEPKEISLCHQYRARPACISVQSDPEALYCWLTNF